MWISRARPPARLTSPTPLTVWMTRAICLSVSSVSVLRLIASDDTINDMTGSASGSTFVMTGGSSSGGTLLIAPATFSRTSLTASLRSRSRTNRTVTLALPSLMRAWISSMPETPLIACSIGSMTDDDISSGLAPGSDSVTLTVAGSARGKRSTPRSRNEKMPSTTRDITSMVANTGRRTQSSDNMSFHPSQLAPSPDTLFDRDLRAVDQFLHVGDRDAVARLDPCQNLDPLVQAIPDLQLPHGELAVVDDEHAIDAVSVLQRAVRQRQHLVLPAALDMDARKRPRLQHRVPIGHQRLERKRARGGVDGRADARHLALERPLRIGVDVELHRLAVLDPRRHLLGDLGDDLQWVDPNDGDHRHLRLDQLTEVDEPLLDIAVERRANLRVAE